MKIFLPSSAEFCSLRNTLLLIFITIWHLNLFPFGKKKTGLKLSSIFFKTYFYKNLINLKKKKTKMKNLNQFRFDKEQIILSKGAEVNQLYLILEGQVIS